MNSPSPVINRAGDDILIQRGAASAVTSLLYLVPPTTALPAWLLFSEPITALTLLGTALTAFGVSIK